MSDDLLQRAARALREETGGDDASARFTRSRIMASVHDERVKRRTRWAFLLPIAATFIAASAYGAATGKTRQAFEVVARALGVHPSTVPAATSATSRGREPSRPRAPAEPPTPAHAPALLETPPEPEPVAPPEPPAPGPAPARVAAKSSAVAPSSTSLPGGGGAAADPTFDLYRSAHHAHFVERDYGRALAAWDAYLRAAPRGSFVPEARYNRALCLVRLQRNDEARAALEPFARGRYGTYRRADAEQLMAALSGGVVGPLAP